MYESEANPKQRDNEELPSELIAGLTKTPISVISRTVLPWGEHCTECVWPTCYTTCDLYVPRDLDGRCRRFAEGMVRIDSSHAVSGYVLKISFKRWGKLWAPGNIRLHARDKAVAIEQRDQRIGSALVQLPLPSSWKTTAINKRYGWKKRTAQRPESAGDLPTSFVIECFNPTAQMTTLSLTMRATAADKLIPFQRLLEVKPGFQRIRIPVSEISAVIDLKGAFSIDLVPNSDAELTTLYFALLDFVTEMPAAKPSLAANAKSDKVKCVVWDLDNTLWSGILVEDGPDKLALKPGIAETIRQLDERGILNSVASKNNHEEAIAVLKRFGIDQYFLYPQISWGPKSIGIKSIAEKLNIGIDTFLFVDDSRFEMEEVRAAIPAIRIVDAEQYLTIAALPACQVPVTEESRNRRQMYQIESERQTTADNFGSDYMAFLRHCRLRVNLSPLSEKNLERVHELTQRTNQMNFSGNRYDRSVLQGIMNDTGLDTYVIDCEDRFGTYGIVGFSIVNKNEPRMTDLMFSCRVQSKRVEHAFLSHIIRKYIAQTGRDFFANYRKTPRNAPSGRVFADIGMIAGDTVDGITSLTFPRTASVPDDGVIEIIEHHNAMCEAR